MSNQPPPPAYGGYPYTGHPPHPAPQQQSFGVTPPGQQTYAPPHGQPAYYPPAPPPAAAGYGGNGPAFHDNGQFQPHVHPGGQPMYAAPPPHQGEQALPYPVHASGPPPPFHKTQGSPHPPHQYAQHPPQAHYAAGYPPPPIPHASAASSFQPAQQLGQQNIAYPVDHQSGGYYSTIGEPVAGNPLHQQELGRAVPSYAGGPPGGANDKPGPPGGNGGYIQTSGASEQQDLGFRNGHNQPPGNIASAGKPEPLNMSVIPSASQNSLPGLPSVAEAGAAQSQGPQNSNTFAESMEKRSQAKEALVQLIQHNVKYEDMVSQGIDPYMLKSLFAELGMQVGEQPQPEPQIPEKRTANEPLDDSFDDYEPSFDPGAGQGWGLAHSRPADIAPDPALVRPEQPERAQVSVYTPQVSVSSIAQSSQTHHAAPQPVDRSSYIAKLLAAKEKVNKDKPPTPSQAAPLPAPATHVSPRNQGKQAKASNKDSRNTDILRKKIEALREAQQAKSSETGQTGALKQSQGERETDILKQKLEALKKSRKSSQSSTVLSQSSPQKKTFGRETVQTDVLKRKIAALKAAKQSPTSALPATKDAMEFLQSIGSGHPTLYSPENSYFAPEASHSLGMIPGLSPVTPGPKFDPASVEAVAKKGKGGSEAMGTSAVISPTYSLPEEGLYEREARAASLLRKRANAADYDEDDFERPLQKRKVSPDPQTDAARDDSDDDLGIIEVADASNEAEFASPITEKKPTEQQWSPNQSFPYHTIRKEQGITEEGDEPLARKEAEIRLLQQKIAEAERRKKDKQSSKIIETAAAVSGQAQEALSELQKKDALKRELKVKQAALAEKLAVERQKKALMTEKIEKERAIRSSADRIRKARKDTLQSLLAEKDKLIETHRLRMKAIRKQEMEVQREITESLRNREELFQELETMLDTELLTGRVSHGRERDMEPPLAPVEDDPGLGRIRGGVSSSTVAQPRDQPFLGSPQKPADEDDESAPEDDMEIDSSDDGHIVSVREDAVAVVRRESDLSAAMPDVPDDESFASPDEYEPAEYAEEDAEDEYEPASDELSEGEIAPSDQEKTGSRQSLQPNNIQEIANVTPLEEQAPLGPSPALEKEWEPENDEEEGEITNEPFEEYEGFQPSSEDDQSSLDVEEAKEAEEADLEAEEVAFEAEEADFEADPPSLNVSAQAEDSAESENFETLAESGHKEATALPGLALGEEETELAVQEDKAKHAHLTTQSFYKVYESPLKLFSSYRFHPEYTERVQGGFGSLTYSHNINLNKPLCKWELAGGICNDHLCPGQHFRDIVMSDNSILLDLVAIQEGETLDERLDYITRLKDVVLNLRKQEKISVETAASQIVAHRSRFLGTRPSIFTDSMLRHKRMHYNTSPPHRPN